MIEHMFGQQQVAPDGATHRPLTAVSLFSGAGGLDIGLERAGFRTVATAEADRDCNETLRSNQAARIPVPRGDGRTYLQHARILEADIKDITAFDTRPEGSTGTWIPDLLVGGPPCQPFSSAGLMAALRDPRGMLFVHFVRLAQELSPRTILFENVRGLVTARGPFGQPGEALNIVKESFESLGYATTFALLNAADYGLPQRRVRMFMMATRCAELPRFPQPTHAKDPSADDELKPWVTLGDFLSGMRPPTPEEIQRPSQKLEEQLRDLPGGSGLKSPGKKEATRPGGHWGYKQGTFIADQTLPARTVTAAATQDWIRMEDGALRRLTLAEVAGLQAFPAEWQFMGSKASRIRQVGNAVPTLMGQLLGECLASALRSTTVESPQSAPLPDKFTAAIRYTEREHARNGASRAAQAVRKAAKRV